MPEFDFKPIKYINSMIIEQRYWNKETSELIIDCTCPVCSKTLYKFSTNTHFVECPNCFRILKVGV